MAEMTAQITFFNPFRIVPWQKNGVRKTDAAYLRGGTYARWHRKKKGGKKDHGRPYITGTLVRSALLTEIEKTLASESDFHYFNFNPFGCCSGKDRTDSDLKPPEFLRRRPAYKLSGHTCTQENPCPFCLIKGTHDQTRREEKKEKSDNSAWTVHFSNFRAHAQTNFEFSEIATERIVNRVDQADCKAKDYFRIWEIDPGIYGRFTGKITLNIPDAEQLEKVESLIGIGMARIHVLAGAVCRIDIKGGAQPKTGHNGLIEKYIGYCSSPEVLETGNSPARPPAGASLSPEHSLPPLADAAERIAGIFNENQEKQKLRRLADAIRALRGEEAECIERLPKGKEGGRSSVWDQKPHRGKQTLREILREMSQAIPINSWRCFCEKLGHEVYLKSKSVAPQERFRLLGETEHYGRRPESDKEIGYVPAARELFGNIWILTGRLRALTPFFFGTETRAGQTGKAILLNRDCAFRIPTSAIRGVLRRDLRLVIGGGKVCRAEVGRNPCECDICRIMRRLNLEDAVSDVRLPPEIRYNIRLNPHTRVVEEGALFDTEVGYQGTIFPFRLYFETDDDGFDPYLYAVLKEWEKGQAFLGGEGGVGFGRFGLESPEIFRWSAKNPAEFRSYLFHRGFRGLKDDDVRKYFIAPEGETMPAWNSMAEGENCCLSGEKLAPRPFPWQEVRYRIRMESPLLSRDPIAATRDERNPDAIMIRKTVFVESESETARSDDKSPKLKPESRYFVKSETVRGVLRSILAGRHGLHDLDHEDCDCLQCRLFGNVHHQGALRFEDAEVCDRKAGAADEAEPVPDKRMDHVAIDRFTGGGADRLKFDDYPLTGSPDVPIVLEGSFWIRTDTDGESRKAFKEESREAFKDALADFGGGSVALGGLAAIGYGWVPRGGLEITDGPEEWLVPLPERTDIDCEDSPQRKAGKPPGEISLKPGTTWYHPHYFLKPPAADVYREAEMVSHGADDKDLLSGSITCRLTTEGPVFTPDTASDDYFGMRENHPRHKNFGFFRIGGKVAIPGASVRGMVSSVYEALTHSCFRVTDQGRYLSRSAEPNEFQIYDSQADQDQKKVVFPGKVCRDRDGKWFIEKMKTVVRLPLYDDKVITDGTDDYEKYIADLRRDNPRAQNLKQRLKNAIFCNRKIARFAHENREFLREIRKKYGQDEVDMILSGRRKVRFMVEKSHKKYDKDMIARLTQNNGKGVSVGYIKFTGPNMLNVKNKKVPEKSCPECDFDMDLADEDRFRVSGFPLHNATKTRASQNIEYPRPSLLCETKTVEYDMFKRCEHVMEISESVRRYEVPATVKKQYDDIMADNQNNTEHISDVFRNRMISKQLSDGDLVYYRLNNSEETVSAIYPVRVSRLTDNRPMGRRFENPSLRPCTWEPLETDTENPDICDGITDYLGPHPNGLCPACHLFGTPYYRGRVGFGMAWLKGDVPKWYMPGGDGRGGRLTLPLLERPRPTWVMPNREANIPGRKFYVHHPWSVDKYIRDRQVGSDTKGEPENEKLIRPNENNRTTEPLDKGNEFVFEVRFHNLRKWELGLLLYALELKAGLGHKIGMGKALGLGSVTIGIRSLCLDGRSGDGLEKTDLISEGLSHLDEKILKDLTPDEKSDYRARLDQLLWLPPRMPDVNVRYPFLKTEEGGPKGYIDLAKEGGEMHKGEERLRVLQTSWEPWYVLKGRRQD